MSDDDLIRRGDVLREIANEGLHILDAAIAALPARGVGVRKLEWHEDFADHPFGWYETIDCGDCIVLTQSGVAVGSLPTLDAAKAAAQADYDARIMAALEPAPAPTDAAHVNETPKSEHDGADVLTAAQAREAALREAAQACDYIFDTATESGVAVGAHECRTKIKSLMEAKS